MTTALVALAGAIWLAGSGNRAAGSGNRADGRRRHSRPRASDRSDRSRPLEVVAVLAAAGACLALSPSPTGLVAAFVLAPAAGWAVRRIEARHRVGLPARDLAWLPLVLDLVGAGLQSGLPLSAALSAAAPDERPWLAAQLRQVAGMLRLGADPAQAWHALAADPRLRPVAVTAIRGATSGIKLAAGMSDLATELRADARAAAAGKAHRAGVWVIAPLGLCFLPAFVCLGIAPIVIGILAALREGGPL